MCNFNYKLNDRSVTGYKIALQVKDKYYSPVTGMRYTRGKVKKVIKYGKNNVREQIGISDVLDTYEPSHNVQYYGMTAMFGSLCDAKRNMTQWNDRFMKSDLCILEMTLTDNLHAGTYGLDYVYIGSYIKSIKKIKNL